MCVLARATLACALAQPSLTLVHPTSRLACVLRRGATGHPIHWHVDQGIAQEIAHYNARRRKNLAGWGAIDTLAGEGYKVRRRPARLAPSRPVVRPLTVCHRLWVSVRNLPCPRLATPPGREPQQVRAV